MARPKAPVARLAQAKPALTPPAPPQTGRKPPASKPVSKPAAPRKRTAKARSVPAEPVLPANKDGVLQLHRPQLETPSANARALAEATARFSARRVRDLLPVSIHTRRLVLRAPIRGDVPELIKLADNPNVAGRLSRLPSPYTRADAIAFVETMSQRADERPYAITLNGIFIGVAGFSFDAGQPPELGYWLGEPHWGQGYASEAVRGLIDAAHQTKEIPLIRARALADNAASLNVLEKAGFRRTGTVVPTEGASAGREVILLELEQPRWTLI